MHSHQRKQLFPLCPPSSHTSGTCPLACSLLVLSGPPSSSTVIRITLMLLAAPWSLHWVTLPNLRPRTPTTKSPKWNAGGLPSRTPQQPCFSMPTAPPSIGDSPCAWLFTSATASLRPLPPAVVALLPTPCPMVSLPTSLISRSLAARPTSASRTAT
jgi:hypothetical protein